MKLTTQSERTLAFILVIIGVIAIIFSVFHAFLCEKELALFGETLREKGLTEFEALSHNLMWIITVLAELVGGFFLASIGMKIIKK
ncbi:MAG: hypothetical protein OEZ29_07830 [Candidatus Bathyarchaeota archaeon]|nr:hypothetical protein [Candidatus Bathyarchaeota archaeon]MDH5780490.1 hypothetical protein [Candidatus Bathyarchaeota archaeon]